MAGVSGGHVSYFQSFTSPSQALPSSSISFPPSNGYLKLVSPSQRKTGLTSGAFFSGDICLPDILAASFGDSRERQVHRDFKCVVLDSQKSSFSVSLSVFTPCSRTDGSFVPKSGKLDICQSVHSSSVSSAESPAGSSGGSSIEASENNSESPRLLCDDSQTLHDSDEENNANDNTNTKRSGKNGAKGDAEGDTSSSERKRRISSGRRKGLPVFSDLRTVPGIGLKTQEKLRAKGIIEVAGLKQLYVEKFKGEERPEKMTEYLRSDVGVMKNHAAAIVNFVRQKVEEELKEDEAKDGEGEGETVGGRRSRRLTFCVEGNISVGKTTFLQRIANQTVELRDLVEIVPEPVGKWQDIGGEGHNILDAFYANPSRYAYTFQNYVFVTRMMQEKESSKGLRPLRLMERSVFSDRMVFVRAVHEAKWMDSMELSIYDSWFDPMVSTLPGLVPDGFIYLRAEPGTCHKRLKTRARGEEAGVSLDYLTGLHEKHEQWLLPVDREFGSSGLLGVSQWKDSEKVKKPEGINVVSVRGKHVHHSIQEVPALVLDCDTHIDFNRDAVAQAEYARKVADFFQYVADMKDAEEGKGLGGREGGISQERGLSPSLILPRGSVIRPDFGSFQPSSSFI